jgi:hypothetical protein
MNVRASARLGDYLTNNTKNPLYIPSHLLPSGVISKPVMK